MNNNTRRIRVVHVFSWLERGGAELRTLRMLQLADRSRFEFHVLAISGRRGSLDREFEAAGAKVHYMALGLPFFLAFPRWLRTNRAGVVHSHIHLASGPMLALAWWAGVPRRIAHFRNTHDRTGGGLSRWLQQRIKRAMVWLFATDIVGVSESALREGWDDRWRSDPRCKVVYNGIDQPPPLDPAARRDLRRDLGGSDAAPLVVHVARMAEQKNHPRVLEVFAALAATDPTAQCVFVGREEPGVLGLLRSGIASLGLEHQVRIVGERSDVSAVLDAADLLVFPSFWEGLPGVVLEACAVGTPVLGSAIAPLVEVAKYLPGVTTLSLAAPNTDWASAARELIVRGRTSRTRDRQLFAESPFQLQQALADLEALWQGGSAS